MQLELPGPPWMTRTGVPGPSPITRKAIRPPVTSTNPSSGKEGAAWHPPRANDVMRRNVVAEIRPGRLMEGPYVVGVEPITTEGERAREARRDRRDPRHEEVPSTRPLLTRVGIVSARGALSG
jgi:hypothetical protein